MEKKLDKKIYILLATYNGEKYTSEQIESLLSQSYQDWKLWIHDDGSKDNTVEIIRNYASQYSQKIVFLDVDGTLVDFKMTMPESARKALELARENGHLLVLCTGRAYCDIYPWLMDFGFDAVVASAGAHVMHNETELYHSFIDPKDLSKLAQKYNLELQDW